MSQNDFTIANQTFPNTRADINSALQALASTSSGSSAPSTTFANQFFYNTTSNLLQIRNEDNDAFITIAELDQTNDTVEYFKADAVRALKIEYLDGDDAIIINDGGGIICPGGVDLTATELILDGDNDTTITANTDDQIDFKIAGSDHIKFTSSGITVSDTDSAQPTINLFNSNADAGAAHLDFTKDSASPADNDQVGIVRFISDNDAGQATTIAQVIANITDVTDGTENGRLGFETMVDGTIAERMTLTGSGYLGVNTSSPQAPVHIVDGSGAVSGASYRATTPLVLENNANTELQFFSGSSDDAQIRFGDAASNFAGAIEYKHDVNSLLFYTNASLRTTVDSSGQMMIGTTTFNTATGHSFHPDGYYTFDATARLKQLKPARFNFKTDADTTLDGFLAHEVQSIVPESITGTKDATKTGQKVIQSADGTVIEEGVEEADWTAGKQLSSVIKDADKNTLVNNVSQSAWTAGKSDGTYPDDSTWTALDALYPSDSTWSATATIPVYQSIDQSKLVPLLVKTIQELEARITALES